MKDIIAVIVAFLIVASLSFGIWKLTRYINFKMSYETQTIELIKKVVKAESINDEYKEEEK